MDLTDSAAYQEAVLYLEEHSMKITSDIMDKTVLLFLKNYPKQKVVLPIPAVPTKTGLYTYDIIFFLDEKKPMRIVIHLTDLSAIVLMYEYDTNGLYAGNGAIGLFMDGRLKFDHGTKATSEHIVATEENFLKAFNEVLSSANTDRASS